MIINNNNKGLSTQLEKARNNYSENLRGAKDKKLESQKPENQMIIENIKKLSTSYLSLSREKIDIAKQNYDIVSKILNSY